MNAVVARYLKKSYTEEVPVENKYFVRVCGTEVWNEVTKKQYVQAERGAGFYSKFGEEEEATAYFNDGYVEGKIEYPTPIKGGGVDHY